MKAKVEHHKSRERLIFFFVAIVLVTLTIVLVKTRTYQSSFAPPVLTTLSSSSIGNEGTLGQVTIPDYLVESGVFVESVVEVESWMLQLDGWIGDETFPESSFFVEEPFIAVQPWMLNSEEWLNPGYLEEMIIPEPWMTQIEAWDSYSAAVGEELLALEEWMLDLAEWIPAPSMDLTFDKYEEELIPLESWMLNDEAWYPMGLALVESAIAEEFVEEEIEVQPWMLNLDEWNLPLRGDVSTATGVFQ